MKMFAFDLVIFDFDGVLVDSEILACQAWSDRLTAMNIPVSLQDMVQKYTGQTVARIKERIEAEYGAKIPDNFLDEVNPYVESLFAQKLQAVTGAHEFIRRLPCPVCIASGSTLESIAKCLRYTKLDEFFDTDRNVFSAWKVPHGKPAPDVFLLAAKESNVPPEKCLVIEDSVAGVTAGKAAGMTVFGFTGGSHCSERHTGILKQAGADKVFASFKEAESALYPSS